MNTITRSLSSQMRALKSRGSSELMLDMVFAAAVPMIISGVAMEWRRIHPRVFRFFTNWARWGWRPKFVRTIEYEKSVTLRSLSKDDVTNEFQRNNILHRAILLYMGQELNLRYSRAQVLLSAVKEKVTFETSVHSRPKKVYGGTAEQLKAYSVNITPPRRDWVSVGDGVFFCQHNTTDANNPEINPAAVGVRKTVIFTFASSKSDGDLRIEAFLNKAFAWYCTAVASTEDHFRYYYTPLTEGGGSVKASGFLEEGGGGRNATPYMPPHPSRMRNLTGAPGVQRYKRYRLGNDKAFDTLFFPEKELLLKILDNFQHKTGKYGIKGYPHKLGLLLHGPPGTGKSSLIKALALHTERHVIDVPLARIQTNQDLMDIMFDESFPVVKQDLPITLAVEDVIFVMEDVDATSPIVRARDHAGYDTRKPSQPQQSPISAMKLRSFRPQQNGRRQTGTAEKAAAVSAGARAAVIEESPAIPAESIGGSAALVSTTAAITTSEPTASPSANHSDSAAAQALASRKPEDVLDLPGSKVAEGAGKEGDGAEGVESKNSNADGNNNSNNDNKDGDAGDNDQDEKGRTSDTPSGSAVDIALLDLMRESASNKKEAEQREKEDSSMTDKLDLAGLLNVLDGVVDSPGRIVIMTTNFPDALDAALIRPGRMDKKIHLGYMKYEAAKEMTRHFFQVDGLTARQDERLRSIFDDRLPSAGDGVGGGGVNEAGYAAGRTITPAVVEQLAGEFDYVDDFIGALAAV